jgi:hypothetical protein
VGFTVIQDLRAFAAIRDIDRFHALREGSFLPIGFGHITQRYDEAGDAFLHRQLIRLEGFTSLLLDRCRSRLVNISATSSSA